MGERDLPPTRTTMLLGWALRASALGIALGAGLHVTAAVRTTPAPPPLVDDPSRGVRFGLAESERRQIFAELTKDEPEARKSAAERFPDQPWSIEDDRAGSERDRARRLAADHGVSVSQVYLVMDEAIRSRWPTPSGSPLPAGVVPLRPRER